MSCALSPDYCITGQSRPRISMRNALLVVDVQVDFVEGGSLPVQGGLQTAAMIARHARHFKSEYQVGVRVTLCAAVNEATGQQALEEMKAAGIQLQAATAP